jgi:hypothetical protein
VSIVAVRCASPHYNITPVGVAAGVARMLPHTVAATHAPELEVLHVACVVQEFLKRGVWPDPRRPFICKELAPLQIVGEYDGATKALDFI